MKLFHNFLWLILIAMFGDRAACEERKDKFIGTLELADFEGSNYRTFMLVNDLTYIDPAGREWYAQHGLITDGASIPQFLWSVIGSPYTGNYRRAAVIHDYYCTNNYREWSGVENAFYNAMITDGVSQFKALLMYYAVVRFGPRWSIDGIKTCPERTLCAKPGDLKIDVATPIVEKTDEDRFKQEVQAVADNLAKNPKFDRRYVENLARSRPSLTYKHEERQRSDNWVDFRWRQKDE